MENTDESEHSVDAGRGEAVEAVIASFNINAFLYQNPVWFDETHNMIVLDVRLTDESPWEQYSISRYDAEPTGRLFFARIVEETGEENIGPPVPLPPMPYALSVSHFWDRMTVEEGDDFDAAMSVATPLKSRRAFNAAVTIQSDSDLFAWVRNVLLGVTTQARAAIIMAQ